MDEYCEKYIKIGLATGPAPDHVAVERMVHGAYREAALEPPELVLLLPGGPLSGLLAQRIVGERYSAGIDCRDMDPEEILAEVEQRIHKQAMAATAGLRVGGQCIMERCSRAGCLHALVRERSIELAVRGAGEMDNFAYGAHDAGWLAYYAFYRDVGGVEKCHKLDPLIDLLQVGWWLPYDKAAIVSSRPASQRLDARGNLHNPNGPAVEYADGWAVHAIDGVLVPSWLTRLPEEEIDPAWLGTLTNATIADKFVNKVGIDRICHAMGAKAVDEADVRINAGQIEHYALLMLDVPGHNQRRPYLRMRNASCPEQWHVEGVHPDCKTVAAALEFRNGVKGSPAVLT